MLVKQEHTQEVLEYVLAAVEAAHGVGERLRCWGSQVVAGWAGRPGRC